jgi:hypothetical protein
MGLFNGERWVRSSPVFLQHSIFKLRHLGQLRLIGDILAERIIADLHGYLTNST